MKGFNKGISCPNAHRALIHQWVCLELLDLHVATTQLQASSLQGTLFVLLSTSQFRCLSLLGVCMQTKVQVWYSKRLQSQLRDNAGQKHNRGHESYQFWNIGALLKGRCRYNAGVWAEEQGYALQLLQHI